MLTPRVRPIEAHERDEAMEELLRGLRRASGKDLNIYATLVRHPSLFRKWLPFGGALFSDGLLNARHREILILRAASRCSATYELVHHRKLAAREGLTDDEIASATNQEIDDRRWSELEGALLHAVDDLHDRAIITDWVWDVLAAAFDERALIEICMLIGHYHMVAFTLNSLGVQVEET